MVAESSALVWNQAEIELAHPLNEGLLSLLAFDGNRRPRLIGTAFIVSAQGDFAIAVTAAHNFDGIAQIQQEVKPKRHPSALQEFLPTGEEISLDRQKVRATYMAGDHVEMCILGWATWDRRTDICFFSVAPQDKSEVPKLFQAEMQVDGNLPSIGDEVAVLGFADMEVMHHQRDGLREEFSISRRLVLRKGFVTQAFPEGHILCRGPCIETTIPVFPGMSGGPVMRLGNAGEPMMPFGVISSDPEVPLEQKNNRLVAGNSIVAVLNATVNLQESGVRKTQFSLAQAEVATNPEINPS